MSHGRRKYLSLNIQQTFFVQKKCTVVPMHNQKRGDKDVDGNGYIAKLSLPSEKDGSCLSVSLPGHFTLRDRDPVVAEYDGWAPE